MEYRTRYDDQKSHYRKPIVGLAGGVGSGKSTVAKILGELGAGVIDSDALAHQELNSEEVKGTLRQWWGNEIFQPDGSVSHQKLAAIIFGDPQQRHRLEALLHPRVAVRREVLISELENQPRIRMVVLDSPLLYETDLDLMCDAVIFVDASLDNRQARSEKQRAWPEGEVTRREKTQFALDTKQARADHVCSNNSSPTELRREVERIFAAITSQ